MTTIVALTVCQKITMLLNLVSDSQTLYPNIHLQKIQEGRIITGDISRLDVHTSVTHLNQIEV